MKTYFYASYMLNVNKADVCAIIKAQSQAQIKRACMHLHENWSRFETYNEAFNYLMLNVTSLGAQVSYDDVRYYDVTNF